MDWLLLCSSDDTKLSNNSSVSAGRAGGQVQLKLVLTHPFLPRLHFSWKVLWNEEENSREKQMPRK